MNIFDYYEDMPVGARLVADFQITDQYAETCWSNLVNKVARMDYESAVREFEMLETELLAFLSAKGVDVYDKKGIPSFKKVCPKSTYRSSKSIILRGLKAGVSLVDTNNTPLGKTALERKIKNVSSEDKTDSTMCTQHLVKFVKASKKKFKDAKTFNSWMEDSIAYLEKQKI